jgi:hypothetical protein
MASKYVAASNLQVGRQELIADLQSMVKVCSFFLLSYLCF